MKKALSLAVMVVFGAATFASAQVNQNNPNNQVLYSQDWGSAYLAAGNTAPASLGDVGWTLFPSGLGNVYTGMYNQTGNFDTATLAPLGNRPEYFAGQFPSLIAMQYTTNDAGNGIEGAGYPSFVSVDPTLYTNVTFSVDSEVSSGGSIPFVTNYWAVQIGGPSGNWYVSATPISNNSAAGGLTWNLNTLVFNPAATNWNTLTIGATAITIGGPASAPLSGVISGIGLVHVWAASFTGGPGSPGYNYENLQVSATISNPPGAPTMINGTGYSVTTYTGGGASFAVNASVGHSLTYSWSLNGGAALVNGPTGTGSTIFGATGSQITISNVSAADAGVYQATVTGDNGSDTTANYVTNSLTVAPLPPEVIYAETFPFVGPFPTAESPTNVGWNTTLIGIPGANTNRLVPGGIINAYQPGSTLVAYYASTATDKGTSGLPFNPINPASYPFVSFRADIAAPVGAANVKAYFIVQNAGKWYVSVGPIGFTPTPGTVSTYGMQFNPAAAGWNQLFFFGGFPPDVSVGGPAAADLTGNLTGAGIFLNYTGAGQVTLANFEMVTNSTPPVLPSFPSEPNVPYPQTVYAGGGATFTFTEAGTLPFTNSWELNHGPALTDGTTAHGSIISGSATTALNIQNISDLDGGTYTAVVSNPAGTSTTDSSTFGSPMLTVVDQPVGWIYSESFPTYTGSTANQNMTTVGWTNASDTPTRIFQTSATTGAGAAYAYEGNQTNSVFYATTQTDTGASGLPFVEFNPADYITDGTNSLVFSGSFASGNANSVNVSVSFAVQIGGNWYVSATPVVPINTPLNGTYTAYSQSFNASASQWNTLNLIGNAGATIGGTPSADLSGLVTGAGLVFQHFGTSGGDINYNSFSIQGIGLGGIYANSPTNGVVSLSWVGNPLVNLQTSPSLSPSSWQDVPNTLGQHAMTITIPSNGTQGFYRLVQHP